MLTWKYLHQKPCFHFYKNLLLVIFLLFILGTEGGIKLYLAEIVTQTKEALGSQSWPRKAQAARAMSTVAKKLGSRLQPPHLGRLLAALVAGLSGRTWNGKVSTANKPGPNSMALPTAELCAYRFFPKFWKKKHRHITWMGLKPRTLPI